MCIIFVVVVKLLTITIQSPYEENVTITLDSFVYLFTFINHITLDSVNVRWYFKTLVHVNDMLSSNTGKIKMGNYMLIMSATNTIIFVVEFTDHFQASHYL